MSKLKPPQPRRKCIFCDADKNITHEHFWPQWLDSVHGPRTDKDVHTQFRARVNYVKREFRSPQLKVKQGNSRSRSVRYVCDACNTGWMKNIQDRLKPILSPLILGEDVSVSPAHMEEIATWATMTTMCAEFDDIEHVGVSRADRHAFRIDPRPLDENWFVFLGRYRGTEWTTRYRHEGGGSRTLEEFKRGIMTPSATYQCSVFVTGELFILTLSSTDPRFINPRMEFAQPFARQYGIVPLCPKGAQEFLWRDLTFINDDIAMDLATFMRHAPRG